MKLSKLKNLNKFSSKGFTLIELLIVIAILGVLAAAVLVAINPAQRLASARNSRVKSDLANIIREATLFNTDSGINAGCSGSFPMDFGSAASGVGCTVTMMAQVNDPNGNPYDIEALDVAGTACDMTAGDPCTAIAIEGPAFSDGVTAAGLWCWRSATGAIVYRANDGACTAN